MKLTRPSLAAALSFCMLLAPSNAQSRPSEGGATEAIVTVGPRDDGNWFVRYSFDAPQPVYALAHSRTGYRSATWSSQTKGVRLGRLNGIDVIVMDEPVEEIEFSIIPLTGQLPNDPTPFVTFAGGGIAVHDAQFELIGFQDIDSVEALDGDLSAVESATLPMRLTVEADGPMLTSAQMSEGSLSVCVQDQYVYIGEGDFEAHEGFSLLADPYLPEWLSSNVPDAVEEFLGTLESRWGEGLGEQVSIIVAYKGAQAAGLALEGSRFDSQIMLELGGQGFANRNSDALAYLHWYTIRELAGLFQTRNGVVLGGPEAAWIHDGIANSIAYQLIAANMDAPENFLSSVYQNAFEDCIQTLESGPLETALERGATTGPYACGDFIALAADGYLKQRNLFDFWDGLSDWAARSSDHVIDKQVYFTALQLMGATPGQRERIRAIVEDELSQPRRALSELLQDAGLEPQFTANGQFRSMEWPDYSGE
ncbi:hypothetical protein D1224_04845 [Henriciella barbarensis]|uniref:Uncharacterized protein n=1 Tax=Henriciella barbarensis TaxID=86342 RepID=A0A399QZU7_9PROT|nr:hypothetical protein [Henriciella barbarensis]RIJ23595.1 hypothetical protein D1224_04845 [Henriciella barbarensis]